MPKSGHKQITLEVPTYNNPEAAVQENTTHIYYYYKQSSKYSSEFGPNCKSKQMETQTRNKLQNQHADKSLKSLISNSLSKIIKPLGKKSISMQINM